MLHRRPVIYLPGMHVRILETLYSEQDRGAKHRVTGVDRICGVQLIHVVPCKPVAQWSDMDKYTCSGLHPWLRQGYVMYEREIEEW